jgi:oxygen-independent coproporphyrinogen-3 oxidase
LVGDGTCPVPPRAADVIGSLRGSPGAYIHIPFCERICPFCPYNKEPYRVDRAERYFASLKREVALYAGAVSGPFTSLYIGGGTPTISLDRLAEVIALVPIAGERAIEVHPLHATTDRIEALAEMGINFVSLGVQSFDETMLRYLCRSTSPTDNLRAVERSLGRFSCVDVDLIFDVAFQQPDVFLSDLERCFSLGVDQVSTYPLMRFGYTPFGRTAHQPSAEHQVLRRAADLARRWGYERRSVWTFNRPAAHSYTSITRPFFVGMGAGSASYTGRLFAVNEFDVERYTARVEDGEVPVQRMFPLEPLTASAYYAFWQAYAGGLDVKDIEDQFGVVPGLVWHAVAELSKWTGYFRRDGARYRLTQGGFDRYHDLERWVTYHFIEPLWREMTPNARIPRNRQMPNGRTVPSSLRRKVAGGLLRIT